MNKPQLPVKTKRGELNRFWYQTGYSEGFNEGKKEGAKEIISKIKGALHLDWDEACTKMLEEYLK